MKPQDIYEIVKNYLVDADQEQFVVMMLDFKIKAIGIHYHGDWNSQRMSGSLA